MKAEEEYEAKEDKEVREGEEEEAILDLWFGDLAVYRVVPARNNIRYYYKIVSQKKKSVCN